MNLWSLNLKRDARKCLPLRWFLNRRVVLFAACTVSATAMASAPEPGYLAMLGPSPLRYSSVFVPSTNLTGLLKPASAPKPSGATSSNAVATAKTVKVASQNIKTETVATTTNANALPPVVTPKPPTPTGTAPNGFIVLPNVPSADVPQTTSSVPQEGVISTEMLLKYFNHSSNGVSSVFVPMEFNPARPAPPAPASSATYQITPKQ